MPVRAPMDRAPFPPLHAYSEENEQLGALASMLLDEYAELYDQFQLQPYGVVRDEWEFFTQSGSIDIFCPRSKRVARPRDSEPTIPRLLAVGTLHASLDDVMFAAVAPTSEAMHVKMAALDSDDADGMLLHTVMPVMANDPFTFCGVKWLLRRPPPGLNKLVRPRDFVFLEATGVRVRRDGERIGYHLCQSIELASTPELSRRGIVRGKMALCHFFRENAQRNVDVWAMETVDMQGDMWTRVAIAEGARALATLRHLPKLATSKKLAWYKDCGPPVFSCLGRDLTADRPGLFTSRSRVSNRCSNCDRPPRLPWNKRDRCALCELAVCSGCCDKVFTSPTGQDPRTSGTTKRCCISCVHTLADESVAAYAAQSKLDPSQRRSSHPPTQVGEDPRPKYRYDQPPPVATGFLKNRCLTRVRTGSVESVSTLTSSLVSRVSAATCPELVVARLNPEERFDRHHHLMHTLARLQVVADATYVDHCHLHDPLLPSGSSRGCGRGRGRGRQLQMQDLVESPTLPPSMHANARRRRPRSSTADCC